jgi:2,4-dienoyl-CoA reductase-like NADH-dependent reductase (Old Yellow Enzyme family)
VIDIKQVKRLSNINEFAERLGELGIDDLIGVDVEVEPGGPLAESFTVSDSSAGELVVGNRFCALPMEGWDGTTDGAPTDLVARRWRRFGESGAKLIWGGEAVAVHPDGRANPHQLVSDDATTEALAGLRTGLVDAHAEAHGSTDDLVVGLQLTHSGRWSRPHGDPLPQSAHTHGELDRRLGVGAAEVLTDGQLDELVDHFVVAAERAHQAGFAFVDVKHCHGYLLHELLSAYERPGRYGGDFEGRTAFLRAVVDGIRRRVPGLAIGVRLSAYDLVPFVPDDDGIGAPVTAAEGDRDRPFGADDTGAGIDLTETHRFLEQCEKLGVGMVCLTAGSPYYNPHAQRPAYFPPSDGYAPPRDPLIDAAVMVEATARLTRAHPNLAVIGSGYSYFQQWLGHVAQHQVRTGAVTSVGIGRNMLSYPWMPADLLAGAELRTRLVCRTFSDCTTGPRHGLISGCYPLDEYYKERPERRQLVAIKRNVGRKVRR